MRGIYDSMAMAERNNVGMLDAARLRRIAAGAGVSIDEVSQFLTQFKMFRRMMESIGWLRDR
jgi:signal recognition particle subunit SRP54